MTPSLPNSAHGELAGVVRLELRPPYLAPLSRGSRCRLRSLHGIRADTCAVADDAGFPCPWLISSYACFTRHGPSNTACRGAHPRVPVT
jgi:hypothetical protein